MDIDQVKALVAEKGVEFFLCSFVEMNGAPKAKVVPVTHLEDMAKEGAGFAGFAAGDIGQMPHDPDMINIPDFRSLTIVPWRKNIAWVAGNIHVNAQPWPYCPRTILQRQLEIARQKGYILNVGVEPEFMLLKRTEQGSYAPWDTLDSLEKPCYDLRALYRNLDIMTTLIKYMQEMGWDPYANDHEDANCQYEINWTYADALTTADRQTFFRWMVRTVAEAHGLLATFMPKPFANLTGNGAHYHMSLWDTSGQQNLFLDDAASTEAPSLMADGLSNLSSWFMGGILKHAKALAAVCDPIVNSYKRLLSGGPRSGATWAPVYITYGGSNRTQMVRLPGPGRIEVRTVDGAANPYLACAALLAAGLDGIEQRIDPGKRNDDNLYAMSAEELYKREIDVLPRSLAQAIDYLEEDEVVKGALGASYADYYIQTKREEWRRYHNSVSQWEIDNYLGVY